MGDRGGQRNVADTLPADAGFRNLNAASVADNTLVSDLFIFTAMALPVLARSEDPLTEQTVLLRL